MSRFAEHAVVGFLRMHEAVYQRTNGLIGHRVPGLPPSLLVHTVGAKTGQPRTTVLSYANDGSDYLIVASNSGANRHPGWYHNLEARPDVEISVGPRRFRVTARIVGPDDPDYARLWDTVNRNSRGTYRAHQRKTTRPIPVIALTP